MVPLVPDPIFWYLVLYLELMVDYEEVGVVELLPSFLDFNLLNFVMSSQIGSDFRIQAFLEGCELSLKNEILDMFPLNSLVPAVLPLVPSLFSCVFNF